MTTVAELSGAIDTAGGKPTRARHPGGVDERSLRAFNTGVLALVAVLLVTIETLMLVTAEWEWWSVVIWESMVSLYFLSGLLATWRQPNNPFGLLLFGGGVLIWCAGLQSSTLEGVALIGHITQSLPLAVVVHLVLAFPYGRLPDRLSRIVVISVYVVCLVLQVPQYVLSGDTFTQIAELPEVATALVSVQGVIGMLGLVAALWLSLLRWKVSDPDRRRRLGPLAWYGLVALSLLIGVVALNLVGAFGQYALIPQLTQIFIILGLPVLFLAGLLTGSFGRAGELREFLASVGAGRLEPAELDSAVAQALGDPSARVVYSGASGTGFVHADGTSAVDGSDPRRRLTPVRYGSEVIGAVLYDSASVIDDRLVDSVARISALAVDHRRVVASLLAVLLELESTAHELRESRYRIVQASDTERRRIARDLHDGVQQSIVVLGLSAHTLIRRANDPDLVVATAGELQRGMADLLAEFRDLVHGIMPAPLIDRGIVSAIQSLGERTAVPLQVRSIGMADRLPQEIESTVYFVVLESVTNAVKHAQAQAITVQLARNGPTLTAEVSDNGRGGAALDGSPGLQGLLDRVTALDGSLTVDSPPGSGTVVKVLIPCG